MVQKSETTWDARKPGVYHGINYQPQLVTAGFLPSTVSIYDFHAESAMPQPAVTPPETNSSSHLKMDGWNTILSFLGWPIFRCYPAPPGMYETL